MVEGYCIYAGWMLAAAIVVFRLRDGQREFLGGFVEYNTIPGSHWRPPGQGAGVREPLHPRRGRRALWPSQLGVWLPGPSWSARPSLWARRVAENSPEALRLAKIQMNKAQDAQGFTMRSKTAWATTRR